MRLVKQDKHGAVLKFSPEELVTLSNALNEALEGVEAWEFPTRMGATRAEAEALLAALGRIQSQG